MINQPWGGGAAAQACLLSPGPGPDPGAGRKWGRKQGAVAAAVQSDGLWAVETACRARQQGARSRHPVPAVLRRAGRRYGALDGWVRAARAGIVQQTWVLPQVDLSHLLLFTFSESFLSFQSWEGTGIIWRGQRPWVLASGLREGPVPADSYCPQCLHGFAPGLPPAPEISPDPTSPRPLRLFPEVLARNTGAVLPASRVPGPGGPQVGSHPGIVPPLAESTSTRPGWHGSST